ncbi:phosphate-starvation-inducible PsiE family protein [Vagococcus intermedius]|uniref:Protein PsiE n=1 Tax=Vagococcus intermedius TaxID=2991418 RepID=A0AAF0CVY3_9ENTE|nr:phosphate-starvation-inducible PsiE family protein [Vagococcus intermedius]WEG73836.1 phosphate-starvation-inducible PsiE family protein [Vagococcus intermedius]WEG75921.1 phosphate-starvation-inducible PsiE family protein [Vagococcus intermedius]
MLVNGNKWLHRFVDSLLIILGLMLMGVMMKQIIEIGQEVFWIKGEFDVVIDKVLSFFLCFEFFTMILRYIQEDHHIPLRYLIYICITAILRQEIGHHTTALNTLLVSLSILLLVITLALIQWMTHKFQTSSEDHYSG